VKICLCPPLIISSQVFDPLHVLHGELACSTCNNFLVTPFTNYQLTTNRDGIAATVTYKGEL